MAPAATRPSQLAFPSNTCGLRRPVGVAPRASAILHLALAGSKIHLLFPRYFSLSAGMFVLGFFFCFLWSFLIFGFHFF